MVHRLFFLFVSCPCRQETHAISVSQALDVHKLGQLDQLADMLGQSDDSRLTHSPQYGSGRSEFSYFDGLPESSLPRDELLVAFWRLSAIVNAPPTFSPAIKVMVRAVASAAATAVFFKGDGMTRERGREGGREEVRE